MLTLKFNLSNIELGPGLWKMNTSMLTETDYQDKMNTSMLTETDYQDKMKTF